jgi:hypothetical protein
MIPSVTFVHQACGYFPFSEVSLPSSFFNVIPNVMSTVIYKYIAFLPHMLNKADEKPYYLSQTINLWLQFNII